MARFVKVTVIDDLEARDALLNVDHVLLATWHAEHEEYGPHTYINLAGNHWGHSAYMRIREYPRRLFGPEGGN